MGTQGKPSLRGASKLLDMLGIQFFPSQDSRNRQKKRERKEPRGMLTLEGEGKGRKETSPEGTRSKPVESSSLTTNGRI